MADEDRKEEEEGTHVSLKGLILGEEEEEAEQRKEEKEEEEEVCAICLGPMDDEEEEDEDDMVCRMQCSHEFHGGCVDSWTSTCTRKGLPLTCPTCRRPLVFG